MTRTEIVREAKAILAEAYESAAEMIALYLDDHPAESMQSLCKEIDPDNWNALRQRVQRAHARLQASDRANVDARAQETDRKRQSHARNVLLSANKRELEELIETLPPRQVQKIAQAAVERLPSRAGSHTGPLDMGQLPKTGEARMNRWFVEGKDLWEKHGDELTPSQRRRFIDKVSGWVAKIAARDLEHV